jgi:hypothetical protein
MEGRKGMPPETTSRRFPPPWTIDEATDACFIVRVGAFAKTAHDMKIKIGQSAWNYDSTRQPRSSVLASSSQKCHLRDL